MTPMTTCFTTCEGIAYAQFNEHSVILTLKHDSGEVVSINVPAMKFRYIVEDFIEAHREPTTPHTCGGNDDAPVLSVR